MKEGEILLGLTADDMKETAYIGIAMAAISFTAAFLRKVFLKYIED